MRAREFITEAGENSFLGLDWDKLSQQQPKRDVKRATIGEPGSEKHKRITAAIKAENDAIDRAIAQQRSAEREARLNQNFAGIGDWIRADDRAGRKLTPSEYRSQSADALKTPAATTPKIAPQSLKGAGGGYTGGMHGVPDDLAAAYQLNNPMLGSEFDYVPNLMRAEREARSRKK